MSGRLIARSLALSAASLSALMSFAACSVQKNGVIQSTGLNAGIIGGAEVNGSEDFSKSVVSLINTERGTLCTATIISAHLLLTAGHCVNSGPTLPKSLVVVFGTNISSELRVIRQVVAFKATPVWDAMIASLIAAQQAAEQAKKEGRVIVQAPSDSDSQEPLNTGDIALVGFAGEIPEGYQPVSMLGDASLLKNGVSLTLAGYGLNFGGSGSEEDKTAVAGTGAGILRYVATSIQNAAFSESEILMDQSQGKGACHGDSGGPAFLNINGQSVLAGVTSRGVNDPLNHCGVSSAYTSVAFYTEWIKTEGQQILAEVNQIAAASSASAQAPAAPTDEQGNPPDLNAPAKRSHKKKAPQNLNDSSGTAAA